MQQPRVTFFALALSLTACAVEAPHESSTAGVSFEEFQARTPREPGTGAYIVEWDLPMYGDDALFAYWSRLQQNQLTVSAKGGVDIKWSAVQKKNLTFCVGASFGNQKAAVVAAMQGATVGGWEKFADVKFVYVPAQDAACTAANTDVVFDVNLAPAGVDYLARAFFPDSPRAERNVLVAIESFDPTKTGGLPLTNILIHELGHTLGFRHEHIRAPGAPCPEDNLYRAVTAYDKVSTMHYPQCGSPGNTLALSELDRSGAALIYGAPVANMPPMTSATAPLDGATVGPSFTVKAQVVDTDLVRAELLVDGVLYQTRTAAPFEFAVTGLTVGAHQLVVRGTDSANQTSNSMLSVRVTGNTAGVTNGDDPNSNDLTGGCAATRGSGGGALLGLGVAMFLGGRRRRGAR